MLRKGHSEEEIVRALRQAEAGQKVSEICREMDVSRQAFYSWKRHYAGFALSELRELRQTARRESEAKNSDGGPDAGQTHFAGVLSTGSEARGAAPTGARSTTGASFERTNARLCKALLDRITDRAYILETGTESYRFRRTAEKQKKGAKTH